MWIPQTEEEIKQGIGIVEESAHLDFKKEVTKSNKEIAKDIAAMTNDGGVIIYGIGEDKDGRPAIFNPIPLKGEPERISMIARSSIDEPPDIKIKTIPTQSDPSKGYIVVEIPLSARAPHMVTIKKDHRYYGRSATGNIRLTHGEVTRLYARRQAWERDQKKLLDGIVEKIGIEPHDDYGYLYLTARPLTSDEKLFDRAKGDENDYVFLRGLVQRAKNPSVFDNSSRYVPDFDTAHWRRLPDGWKGYLYQKPDGLQRKPKHIIDTEISLNGQAYLFCGRAAEKRRDDLIIFEEIIAGITTRFLSLIGDLYTKSGYLGPVDIGILVTDIKGGISYSYTEGIRYWAGVTMHLFERPEYRKIIRRFSSDLLDKPKEVASSLVMPLIHTTTQGDPYNPFDSA